METIDKKLVGTQFVDTMDANEKRKLDLLMNKARNLGMDTSGYGHGTVNQSSGNVWIWLEEYPFTLYIPPYSDDEIYAVWIDPYNGEEHEVLAQGRTLTQLVEWCNTLHTEAEEGYEY
jgi:hypothetical protein